MVVVPGINDGDNIQEVAEFLSSLPYIKGVECLPYHGYGITKYGLLNRPYSLPYLKPPSEELIESCGKAIIAFGLNRTRLERAPKSKTTIRRTLEEFRKNFQVERRGIGYECLSF